jgi:hypothetical protein
VWSLCDSTPFYYMNLITEYWEQLIAFCVLVAIISDMRVEIKVLKEKVGALFDLWNSKN